MNPNRMANKGYWIVGDTAIGCTEKAGATSIMNALQRARCKRVLPEQIEQLGLRTRLWVRHPIERFASVWAFFTPVGSFPRPRSRAHDYMAQHPTIEQFTDAVLDGAENEHWLPQLAQHVPIDEVLQFETINETFPVPIEHMNKGQIEKPEITYRLDELEIYYGEDLTAWLRAKPMPGAA